MVVVVAGFGNPLLDYTIQVENNSLHKKYNLNEDDAKEISHDEMNALIFEIQNFNYVTNSGGCSQNTIKILQIILQIKHSTAFFGAIGNDKNGELLKELLESSGVQTRYTKKTTDATGIMISIVKGVNRSLVGNIGASNVYEINDLKTTENLKILNEMQFAYMEGFFLPNRITVAKFVLNFCKEHKKRFIFNVSASYLCENSSEDVIHFANNCDILFGNSNEFQSLCSIIKKYKTIKETIQDLCGSYNNIANYSYGKIIVVTNGAKNVICAHSQNIIEEIKIPNVSNIVDTTGAGDSFVAGFLAALLKELPPLIALKWGCWVSQQVIQQIGCNISNVNIESLFDIK